MHTIGAVTFSDLQAMLGLEQSTLNRQVNSLVRAGYVMREPVGKARVPARYIVTPEGQEAWVNEREMTLGALEMLMSDWTEGEREIFAQLLRRFNLSIESQTGLSWPAAARNTLNNNA